MRAKNNVRDDGRATRRRKQHKTPTAAQPGMPSTVKHQASGAAKPERSHPAQDLSSQWRVVKWIGLAVLLGVFAWSYGPTWLLLVRVWIREPDYSHGFLVIPVAAYFLWARRDRVPQALAGLAGMGFLVLLAACGLRVAAAAFYIDAVDAWSLLLWIAGAVWLFGGWRLFAWASPSLAFLCFMVPLPFRGERLLSYPLQRIATKLSCWALQILGQPAMAEGNTILLGDHQLNIEDACSGLRIFVSIMALAFAYIVLVRRTWWEKLLLLASTLPIALAVNAMRIVVTGILWQHVSGEAAAKFSHDLAGWIMIPLATALFGLVLWYLGRLFCPVERMVMQTLVRDAKARRARSAPT